MSDKEFTIPVVLDPSYMAKLNSIEEAVKANQEAIVELKKITLGTSILADVDLNEEDI